MQLQEKAENTGPPWCDREKCNTSFLWVVTFYRVILYLKCAIVMSSFAIHCDSTIVMSSSSIHGSVRSALLGVLLLHLRYVGIKLSPAGGVFCPYRGKISPTQTTECF